MTPKSIQKKSIQDFSQSLKPLNQFIDLDNSQVGMLDISPSKHNYSTQKLGTRKESVYLHENRISGGDKDDPLDDQIENLGH
jgi:hypothetical protein